MSYVVRSRTRLLVLVSALALAIGLLVGGGGSSPARAASPGSGTVSPTQLSTSWTGGPFLVPNPTAEANGVPDCSAPQSCDTYNLTVSTPASYATKHQLRIAVSWPNQSADFDVYVENAAGTIVATAATSADPETVIMPPAAGTYHVVVVPFLPLGQSYGATATLQNKPTNPPPSTQPAPPMRAFAAPLSLPNARSSGEPSIGVNWKTGSVMYQSYVSTYKVRVSGSGTGTRLAWSDASATAAKGCPQGSTTSLDPILYTDNVTGRTFESQLSGVDSLTCYTDNDGTTWSPSQGGGIPSGVDHQTLGGGPFAPGALPHPTYPRAVYYCSQDIATAFCASSIDGGVTFGAGIPTYNLNQCGGLHGHIMVGPDGTAYLPNKSCGSNQAVVVSTDNGTTWTIRKDPASTSGDSDPGVAVGARGSVYLGYVGSDGVPRIAVSHNRGQTWQHDQAVGARVGGVGIRNAVFPTVVAGDDNRAAFSFLGTTTDGNYQDAAHFHGVWYQYTAYTYDGGAHWSIRNATPGNPVQVGSICTAGTTCGSDRNLLDFIGSTIDKRGNVMVAFADGCTGTCVRTHKNNFDARATISRQIGGKPLFARYDPATAARPAIRPATRPATAAGLATPATWWPTVRLTERHMSGCVAKRAAGSA
ncbi:MAG: sialidase family protein [Nocardioidaceae bacterium]